MARLLPGHLGFCYHFFWVSGRQDITGWETLHRESGEEDPWEPGSHAHNTNPSSHKIFAEIHPFDFKFCRGVPLSEEETYNMIVIISYACRMP